MIQANRPIDRCCRHISDSIYRKMTAAPALADEIESPEHLILEYFNQVCLYKDKEGNTPGSDFHLFAIAHMVRRRLEEDPENAILQSIVKRMEYGIETGRF